MQIVDKVIDKMSDCFGHLRPQFPWAQDLQTEDTSNILLALHSTQLRPSNLIKLTRTGRELTEVHSCPTQVQCRQVYKTLC